TRLIRCLGHSKSSPVDFATVLSGKHESSATLKRVPKELFRVANLRRTWPSSRQGKQALCQFPYSLLGRPPRQSLSAWSAWSAAPARSAASPKNESLEAIRSLIRP